MDPHLATRADAPRIAAILRAAFEPLRDQYTDGCYQATISSAEALRARHAEGPTWLVGDLGTVGAVPRPDGVYLRSMAVVPAARGKGVGTTLMETVEAYARQQRARRIYLSTTPFLHAAIRLYEVHGFVRTGAPPHELHGTPVFTMAKPLKTP